MSSLVSFAVISVLHSYLLVTLVSPCALFLPISPLVVACLTDLDSVFLFSTC